MPQWQKPENALRRANGKFSSVFVEEWIELKFFRFF